MEIILSPVADSRNTVVSVSGLVVTVDGIDYDLSVIPAGGDAQPDDNEPFIGTMTRDRVTVLYRYDGRTALPDQPTDIAEYTFDVSDGRTALPDQPTDTAEYPFDVSSGVLPDPVARKPEDVPNAD